mgnify:CR=1 FL=1
MANNKVGFIYYSVNTDRYSDIKLKRLKKKHKCNGLAVYDKILCEIYREKGYYIEWNEIICFDVAEYFELLESEVNDIVAYCCEIGLFNQGKFTSFNILTSASIQARFVDWSKKAKRNNDKIQEELKIIQEEKFKKTEESSDISCSLPQSKVKESKVKESKGKERESPASNFLWFLKYYHSSYETYKNAFNGQSTTEDFFNQWKKFIDFIYDKKFEELFNCKFINPHDFAKIVVDENFTPDKWERTLKKILSSGVKPEHNLFFRIPEFMTYIKPKQDGNSKSNGSIKSNGSGLSATAIIEPDRKANTAL